LIIIEDSGLVEMSSEFSRLEKHGSTMTIIRGTVEGSYLSSVWQ
jgi:hypothetical protein